MAKQVGVFVGVPVNVTARLIDEPGIAKIAGQCVIESGECAGAAHYGQGQNVAKKFSAFALL